MRTLTNKEIYYTSGGYEQSVDDGMIVSGAFSAIFSIAGAISGVFWHLETTHATLLSTGIANTMPVALFAGIGIGAFTGAIVGIILYYAGAITRSPLSAADLQGSCL